MIEHGVLKQQKSISIDEQLGIFLMIVGHADSNQDVQERFQCSGSTVSKYFLEVLNGLSQLYLEVVNLPNPSIMPPEIHSNPKFYPYFQNCIGAADGTHILAKFCYILAGWEGSAHDGRVLQYALSQDGRLVVPDGKYYLVDAGYAMKKGFLPPYRGIRYHLREQILAAQRPNTKEELFNLRHSQLRNAVERIFGILKKRFSILKIQMEYPFHVQAQIVQALAALHNFITIHSVDDELEDWEEAHTQDMGNVVPMNNSTEDDPQMARLRDEIALQMWEDYQRYTQ
ncbi:putative nuclease HARBI1 [Neolecta irregularis DAH-3]|uniref:Putative nuclease HARBI1 n=1 Tax=Neolecta irregularis (strain DAH-3) TaxID=1198029 RepID=A0A1U7LS90_NEOID|nr:putative nuclease HARBI1 [Neolecta irregularis DAH-3]|eukprot:OLL25540.1 putative nuclease HARBI1 [Neolecta irregularis DAH-3]